MARATLEIVATVSDRASSAFNRLSAAGQVAGQRVAASWDRISAPITRAIGVWRRLEGVVLAFVASRAVRGLDRLFDKFGGFQYDVARRNFIGSLERLGRAIGNSLGPKFANVLDQLSSWVDRNQARLVKAFEMIANELIAAAKAVVDVFAALRDGYRWVSSLPYKYGAGMRGMLGPAPKQDANPPAQQLPPPQAGIRRVAPIIVVAPHRGSKRGPLAGYDEEPYPYPPPVPSRTYGQFGGEPSFIQELRSTWNRTTLTLRDRAVDAAFAIESNLSGALTDMILDLRNASDYFREFGKSVVRTVVQMFVETGVRQLFGLIIGAGSGAGSQNYFGIDVGGAGARGAGGGFGAGGGGGTTFITNHINAIDAQSFAVAAMRSERATGVHRRMMTAAAYSGRDFRQAMQLR